MKKGLGIVLIVSLLLFSIFLNGCIQNQKKNMENSEINNDRNNNIKNETDSESETFNNLTKNNSITKTLEIGTHKIHSKNTGIIFPLNSTEVIMTVANITINPRYWMCMVDNYDFIVTSKFTLFNPTKNQKNITLIFPFSTHNVFGDHDELKSFDVYSNSESISYNIAINNDLYSYNENESYENEGFYYQSEYVTYSKHGLLLNAYDMYEFFPVLYNDGFEMFAFWNINFSSYERKVIEIEFIHYSGISCSEYCKFYKNYFEYNISYAKYWKKPVMFKINISKNYNITIKTSLEKKEFENFVLLNGLNLSEQVGITIYRPPFMINGHIFDMDTNNIIKGAKIKINGTKINTTSNESGYFKLEIDNIGYYNILIFKEGYYDIEELVKVDFIVIYHNFYLERINNI